MNHDELAFFNQQLAAMLREGIPLEASLKQLCAGMRTGSLRAEFTALEADLARGTPLKDALSRRKLPKFYVRMVEVGARANDLPGVLTMLADHYHRTHSLWTRLKGLMVYPLLVLLVSLGLTLMLSLVFTRHLSKLFEHVMPTPELFAAGVWIPPIMLALAAVLLLAGVFIPAFRARLRWRLPAFREASLAQLASAIGLMLRSGTPLPNALALAEGLEAATPAAPALARWRLLVESGQGKPVLWTGDHRPFPRLFLWLIQKGGEDLSDGFQKAAAIYEARAAYRIELALYGALPVSILLLGQMVLWQVAPMVRALVSMMNMLGDSSNL